MRKTDKKMDNNIRQALTSVCEIALDQVNGFEWLTHFVSYDDFPGSLTVVCVFDTIDGLAKARAAKDDDLLRSLIKDNLVNVGIALRNIRQHVFFDSEEACANENGGKWHERFRWAGGYVGATCKPAREIR